MDGIGGPAPGRELPASEASSIAASATSAALELLHERFHSLSSPKDSYTAELLLQTFDFGLAPGPLFAQGNALCHDTSLDCSYIILAWPKRLIRLVCIQFSVLYNKLLGLFDNHICIGIGSRRRNPRIILQTLHSLRQPAPPELPQAAFS